MLDLKALLAKILSVLVGLTPSSISYQIANTTQISNIAGGINGIRLPDGHYVVFFSLGFKTNTTRGTATGVFRFVLADGYILQAVNPYFFPCITSGATGFSYGNSEGYWLGTSKQWTANTDYRVSGVGIFNKTNTHI